MHALICERLCSLLYELHCVLEVLPFDNNQMLIANRDASAHYFRSAQLYVVRPHVQIEINVCHMYSGRLMCELLSKLMSDD